MTGENRDDSGKAHISENCPTNKEEETNDCDMATLEISKGKNLSMLPFHLQNRTLSINKAGAVFFLILRYNLLNTCFLTFIVRMTPIFTWIAQ